MCCFQAANFSHGQREIPGQLLAFLERRAVFLDPAKRVHTAQQTTAIELGCQEASSIQLRLAKRFAWKTPILTHHLFA